MDPRPGALTGPAPLGPADGGPAHVVHALVPDEPWRNGRGTTRRLHPAGSAPDTGWWVSVAALVRDGPFSAFPGIDRTFTAVGAPVDLLVNGRAVRAEPLRPVSFPGEAVVSAHLPAGPAHAVNLLVRRGVRVRVGVLAVDGPLPPASAAVLLSGSGTSADGAAVAPLDLVRGPAACRGKVLVISVDGTELHGSGARAADDGRQDEGVDPA